MNIRRDVLTFTVGSIFLKHEFIDFFLLSDIKTFLEAITQYIRMNDSIKVELQ